MAAVARRRMAALPDVGRGEISEDVFEHARRDERQRADRRRRMTGGADETRVFVVGDGKPADEELADADAVNGTLVGLGVRRAHEEIAGGDSGEIGCGY